MELLANQNRQVFRAPFTAKLKTTPGIENGYHFRKFTIPEPIRHYFNDGLKKENHSHLLKTKLSFCSPKMCVKI